MNEKTIKASDNNSIKHFDIKAEEWDLLYKRASFKDRLNLFISPIIKQLPKSAVILDYGCGTGTMSFVLGKKGYSVIGVDASEEMVNKANRKRPQGKLQHVDFKVINPENMTFTKDSFDAIICSSVLEYITDDYALINILANTLKPKGIFLISVPHDGSLIGKFEDLLIKMKLRGKISANVDVFYAKRRYNKDIFQTKLKSFSLEIQQSKYFECPVFGKFGVLISRVSFFGVMLFNILKKIE